MRLKMARMGAIAACVSCQAKFTVDQRSLTPADQPRQGQAEPGSMPPTAPQAALATPRQPRPDAPPPPGKPRRSHSRPVVPVAVARPAAPPPADDLSSIAVAAARPPARRVQQSGVNWGMVFLLLVVMVLLAGMLYVVIAFRGESPFKKTVYIGSDGNPIKGEIVIRSAQGTTTVVQGDGKMPADAPATGAAPGNAPATAAAAGSSAPAAAPRAPLPVMSLEPMQAVEGQWKPINPPGVPLEMSIAKEALLWTPQLRKDTESNKASVTIQYLTEIDAIYEDAFLNVQLLDSDRKAFAQLTHVVPVVISRQGMSVSVPVPGNLLEKAQDVVADIDPRNPVEDGVPLEMVQSQRVEGGEAASSGAVELTVLNPFDFAVNNPMFVLQVLNGDGWVVGLFRGNLKAAIQPHAQFSFQVDPKLPKSAEPARVVVRGFAHRAD